MRKLFGVGMINGAQQVQIRFMSSGTIRLYIDGRETDLVGLEVKSLSELKETLEKLNKRWYKLVKWD